MAPVQFTNVPTVLLVQTAMDDYRQAFIDHLMQDGRLHLRLLVGEEYFKSSVKTRIELPQGARTVANHFIAARRLLWQRSVIREAITADIAVLELNPRILSNWPTLVIRRICKRRTILWGHAWSRRGPSSRTESLRNLMRRFATLTLVYTMTGAQELRIKYPHAPVAVAVNAILSRHEMIFLKPTGENIIYCGRLAADKRPALMISAFARALDKLPATTCLVIVGDGPELPALKRLAANEGLTSRIIFAGRATGCTLRRHYERSRVSVSPGYVGLSLLQSLGYGRPMIIADDELHAPEIEAAEDGVNALFFEARNPASLAEVLQAFFQSSSRWSDAGPAIVQQCQSHYSVEQMARQFVEATLPVH